MGDLLPFAIVGGIVGSFVFLGWMAARVRRRGSGSDVLASVLSAHDELWYPTAHESHIERRIDEERKAPVPTPDKNGRRWRVTLPAKQNRA